VRKPPLHVVYAALACGALDWALHLSRSGRTLVDGIVIGLLVAAVLWNLLRLGQRLWRSDGARGLGHLGHTLALWVLGLTTLLLRPQEVDTWRTPAGWTLIALAIMDSLLLLRREQRALAT